MGFGPENRGRYARDVENNQRGRRGDNHRRDHGWYDDSEESASWFGNDEAERRRHEIERQGYASPRRGGGYESAYPGYDRRWAQRNYSSDRTGSSFSRGYDPYSDYPYRGGNRRPYGGTDWEHERNRDFLSRAGDEVASWFGDEEAARRRERDEGHRGKGPKNYMRSDERLHELVSDELADDRHIDASDIDVSVSDGEVTLDGTVTERFAKRHAEDIAERISGIKHVQNNLRVKDQSKSMSSTNPNVQGSRADNGDASRSKSSRG